MEYMYTVLLLDEAGKELNEENLLRVLEAAGCEPIESRVKALVAAFEEVDFDESGFEQPGIDEIDVSSAPGPVVSSGRDRLSLPSNEGEETPAPNGTSSGECGGANPDGDKPAGDSKRTENFR